MQVIKSIFWKFTLAYVPTVLGGHIYSAGAASASGVISVSIAHVA